MKTVKGMGSLALLIIAIIGCNLTPANAESSDQGIYFSPEVAYVLPVDGEIDDTIFIGGRLGFGLGNGLSLEAESGWAEYGFDPTSSVTNVDITTIPVLANLRYGNPATSGSPGWYGYGGAGWAFNEMEDNNFDTEVDDSFVWQLGGGMEFPVTTGVLAFLDVRYLWNRADLVAPAAVIERTDDDAVLTSVLFTTGVRF